MDMPLRARRARLSTYLFIPRADGVRRTLSPGLLAALVCALFLAACSRGSHPRAGRDRLPPAVRSQNGDTPATKGSPQPQQSADENGAGAARIAADADAARSLLESPPTLDPTELVATASEDETALLDELLTLTLPDGEPKQLSHEEALLHTRSELPLELTEDVKRLLTYFTTNRRGKATIKASLGRGSAYRQMIERIFAEEDVPREIYYLAMAESGFRPKAHSRVRATGMWQFMSSRGKQYGLRQDRFVDLRYDAETATRAAARHLKDLHIEFGDWYLAMAAYNSGPNRVKSAIRRTGSRDYWTLVKRRALPRETRNYVPIILAMTLVGENLDLFDLGELDYAPPLEYDTVRTSGETSFALIADITEVSVEAIKDLNQALLRSATPPYAYDLRLPKGSAEQFEREIATVPSDKRLNWRRYEVRPGETLAAVANRYKVTPQTLRELNSLAPGSPLQGGERLTVPSTTKLAIYRYYGMAGGLLEPGTGRYRIAAGDTLGGIARRFRTTVSNLQQWNGLTSTRIRAGRYLIVDPNAGSGTSTVAAGPAPTGRYTVRSGDSLSTIGARVGATVAQLKAWNGIRGTTIRVGQTLKVPGPAPQRASSSGGSGSSPDRYLIRSGDALSTIAARFGVSVSDLRKWNNLRGNRIRAGSYLVVRPPSSTPAKASPPPAVASARTSEATGDPTRYTVRPGDTLGHIAERFNTTAANLRAWNGIRGSSIRAGQVLVVGQSAQASTAQRGRADTQQPTTSGNPSRYTVRPGDTLGHIAERFGTTAANLRAWNGIRGSTIRTGQVLIVGQSAQASTAQTVRRDTAQSITRDNPGRYTVRPGDTLGHIAERFGITAAQLRAWNGIRGSTIRAGQELIVGQAAANRASQPSTAAAASGAASYTVRSGDSLDKIARLHGTTVANLRRWNGLSDSRIYPGQKLAVGAHAASAQTNYRIRRGDSLELIAKRFGVSVNDLMRWNGLRSSRIRQGDTLVIRPTGS